LPALAHRNSRERRRNALPARPRSVSSLGPQMRTPCGCWLACKPIVRRSAQLATRSWSATASDPGSVEVRPNTTVLWGTRQSFPARVFSRAQARVWPCRHAQKKNLERLTVPSLVGLNLAGARPLRLTAKVSKPRCPPGGALLLEPTARQAGWWNQTSSSEISIHLSELRRVR